MALTSLVGALLCFIPLFNLLGYESALVTGVVTHLAAAVLTCLFFREEPDGPLGSGLGESSQRAFMHLLASNLSLILPPAALLSLNALRVTNCSWEVGLGFFALIPVFAVLMGQLVGWAACALFSSTRARIFASVVVILGNGLALAAHVALQPPITGHQWAIGFLSGSIYDEALSVPSSLLWYRVTNLTLAMVVVWGIEAWRQHELGRGAVRRFAGLAVSALVLFAGMTGFESSFGVRIDRAEIAARLGGVVETEHFIIYYPLSYSSQLELMIEDHEFRYAEMQEYFGTDPVALHGRKVRSFVYPDRETKGELMGARRTLIAKIWLREVHILWSGYGDHLLAHELAHVFTEPFGAGPLRLSMQNGVGVNMGLVEGIATAADWPAGELDPHLASAAMRQLDIAPDIRGLVGASGFWSQSSGKAYTLMGSFVAFLVDEHGIEKFKLVYADGDFQRAYGQPAGALVSEWEAFLDELEVTDLQLQIARYRYERPSIFGKTCARTIGELRRQAGLAAGRGEGEVALEIYKEILGYEPGNTSYELAYVRLLIELERADEALGMLDEMRARELVPSQAAAIDQLRADIFWRRDQFERARALYETCQQVGVLDGTRRMLQVKESMLAAERRGSQALIRAYLLEEPDAGVAIFFPMKWASEHPEDPLANYLIGRQLWGRAQWEHARMYLELAASSLKPELLRLEARHMLAQVYYHLGQDEDAKELLEELARAPWSRLQTEADEFTRRVSWRAKNN